MYIYINHESLSIYLYMRTDICVCFLFKLCFGQPQKCMHKRQIGTCKYIHMCICIYVMQHPQNLPTYLPTYLPVYSLTYLPTYPPTHLPTYLPTYLPTCLPTKCTLIRTFMQTRVHACMYNNIRTSMPVEMPTCIHTERHTCSKHAHLDAHARSRTHAQTHARTRAHTHTCISAGWFLPVKQRVCCLLQSVTPLRLGVYICQEPNCRSCHSCRVE